MLVYEMVPKHHIESGQNQKQQHYYSMEKKDA